MRYVLPNLIIVDNNPLSRNQLADELRPYFKVYQAESHTGAIKLLRHISPAELILFHDVTPLAHELEEIGRLFSKTKLFCLNTSSPNLYTLQLKKIREQMYEALEQPFERVSAILGNSPAIQHLHAQIEQYATLPFPLLIEGESGSGKELVAQSLHQLSGLPIDKFKAINCAAISPNLIESTLFGHCKGSFTGATAHKAGFFEEAELLFLDEIGELPLELQAKLLRVLENGEYQRVGETQTRISRARIIAATNRNLALAVSKNTFRADLYHRLKILHIQMPTLREMGTDKLLLLDHYRKQFTNAQTNFRLTGEAQQFWLDYNFPGNIRELRNIVIRLSSKYPQQMVSLQQLKNELETPLQHEPSLPAPEHIKQQLRKGCFHLDQYLREQESTYINMALGLSRGNVSAAAKLLGIKRTTLHSRIDTQHYLNS